MNTMNGTMERIHELSNERQELWQKAGRKELSPEEYWRLQQISRQLEKMWDSHRRQQAAGSRRQRQPEKLAQTA